MVIGVARKIYDALDRDACGEALVLLKDLLPASDADDHRSVVRYIASVGDDYRSVEEYAKAEEAYKLGLALYEKCFYTSHAESIPCLYGLLHTLRLQKKEQELENTLNRGYLIIRRFAKALSRGN